MFIFLEGADAGEGERLRLVVVVVVVMVVVVLGCVAEAEDELAMRVSLESLGIWTTFEVDFDVIGVVFGGLEKSTESESLLEVSGSELESESEEDGDGAFVVIGVAMGSVGLESGSSSDDEEVSEDEETAFFLDAPFRGGDVGTEASLAETALEDDASEGEDEGGWIAFVVVFDLDFDFLVSVGFSFFSEPDSESASELSEGLELASRLRLLTASVTVLLCNFAGGGTLTPLDSFSSSASLSELMLGDAEDDADDDFDFDFDPFFTFTVFILATAASSISTSESLSLLLPLLLVSSFSMFTS